MHRPGDIPQEFYSRPDTVVPPNARREIAEPRQSREHSLAEISEILYAKGETDRRLRPHEIQRIIDRACAKLRRRLKRIEFE